MPEYSTQSFAVPLSVRPAETLDTGSVSDAEHLLTWDATPNEDNKVRFLSPVEVYPPGATGASSKVRPTPEDYARYVLSLGGNGVKFTEVKKTAVDGRPATLMTVANSGSGQNGSLGCAEHGDEQQEVCFGIQPEYKLRFAVMTSGPPLAIWARTDVLNPDRDFLASFEAMLKTVHFQ